MNQPDYRELVDELIKQGHPWTSLDFYELVTSVRLTIGTVQRARVLAELRANPPLATSGNPGISRALQRLLIDVSTQGCEVVFPACERCNQQAFLIKTSPEGQRICRRCEDDLMASLCGTCGNMRKVDSRIEGVPICSQCARRQGNRSDTCIACGRFKNVNKRTSDGPLCYNCSPHERVCLDCGETKRVAKLHTVGPLCHACHARRRTFTQSCPQCQNERLVAYSAASGNITCSTCAGAVPIYSCIDCGTDNDIFGRRCANCERSRRLDLLFTGPDGQTPTEMIPVKAILMNAADPARTARWAVRSTTANILKDIVNKSTPATYEGLSSYPSSQARPIRALLEEARILDPAVAPTTDFEQWLETHLADVPSPRNDLIRRFALWGVFPRVKISGAHSDHSNVRAQLVRARLRVRIVTRFLNFLEENNTDIHLADHSLYDRYTSTHPETHVDLTNFIRWIRSSRLPTRIKLSKLKSQHTVTMLDQATYQSTIQQLAHNDEHPVRARLVGLLVGLYGIKLTRIATLKTENIIIGELDLKIRLASDAIAVPRAMADLLDHQLKISQLNLQGTSSTWLFPSVNSGRHVHPQTFSHDMKRLGINTVPFRGAAIFNLIQTMPLSVVHDFTGVAHSTLLRWSEISQRDWTNYPTLRMS